MPKLLGSRFKVAAGVAVLLATLLVAVGSAPAGAGVATKSTKVCKAIANIGNDVQKGADSSGVDSANLETVANNLKKAANKASGKIKSALKTLASGYQSIANADGKLDQAQAAASFFAGGKYRGALQTFITYYTKNCVGISVPTT
jgi:hypothetical protein